MGSPTQRPAGWYYLAAIICFWGAVVSDGLYWVGLLLGGRQPALAGVFLYIFTALFSYLAILHFNSPHAFHRPQWILSGLVGLCILSFGYPRGVTFLLGLGLIGVAGPGALASIDTLNQMGCIALTISGFYALVSAVFFWGGPNGVDWLRLTHPWLGGVIVILWVTALAWYLLDRGLLTRPKVEQALHRTAWVVLVAGIIGLINHGLWFITSWYWRPLPIVLRFAELVPFYHLLWREFSVKTKRLGAEVGFWVGWFVLLTFGSLLVVALGGGELTDATFAIQFHVRGITWPLLIVGLVLFPSRHGKKLLLRSVQAGRSGSFQEPLRLGVSFYFLALWQVALVSLWRPPPMNHPAAMLLAAGVGSWYTLWLKILFVANVGLLSGYFWFLRQLFLPSRMPLGNREFLQGESHALSYRPEKPGVEK